MMIGEGRKRSLTLSLDFVHSDQRLLGYRKLDLLNSHEDPTFLRPVLYSRIAGEYIPTPKANYVRAVINGESWGVYVNAQHFNKDFTKESFGSAKGARWKVPGSPRASGGLTYLGEQIAEYKKHYEIKSKDDPQSWKDLIRLCRVLNETPAAALEKKLSPLLDIEGALKFLALENVFINNDGYWIRTSDYNLYEDEKGQFHLVPHDVNETFAMPGGPGFGSRGGGPAGGGGARVNGVELDPLTGANDPNKPLLNKLLAVPALKARYLGYVRDIAQRWLDWKKIGPLAEQYQALIAADVKTDTHKLDSDEAFVSGVKEDGEEGGFRGPRRRISLKSFVEQRRAFLLNYEEIKRAAQR
jgi:spore coat protein CotH